jgi:hypothetical protein
MKGIRILHKVMLVSSSFLFTACVTLPTISPNPASPIKTVAVLPLVNNTNDVDGPRYVREQLARELPKHYYVVRPVAEVDQILKDRMGVTLASQLDMATPKKLGETLGVDGVIYGALDDFSHTVTGAYNVKRVRLRVKLVNCKTGETVWKNGVGVKSTASAGAIGSVAALGASVQDKQESEELKPLLGDTIGAPWHTLSEESGGGIAQGLAMGLLEKVASKALGRPLQRETEAAVQTVLNGYYHEGGLFSPTVTYGQGIPSGSAASVHEAYAAIPGIVLPGFDMIAGAMFTYAFNVHGYWLGDKTYRPGEWTRWRVTVKDEDEKAHHELEKAFLKREADGKEWWRVAYVEQGDGATFEAQFAAGSGELLRLRGRVAAGEPPTDFPVTKGHVYQQPTPVRGDSLKSAFVRRESVTVPAGTFTCNYYVYSPIPTEISEWWMSDQVPGGLVKYLFREGKGASPSFEMALIKFGQNATTVLNSF